MIKSTASRSLRSSFAAKKMTVGSWISLAHPAIAEIMANSGFDWLAVDLEHSVITIREAEELIRIIALSGVTPLVRLSSNDHIQIKRVMDAGAHGIIVPMVNSPEDAWRAVKAVHYPPLGTRGVGLARAQGYGATFNDYKKWLAREAVVIVQIEHIDAVRNIDAILATPGVSGYMIGPYDLSGSLQMPGELRHPKVLGAIQTVKRAAARSGVPAGIHIISPEPTELRKRAQEGYQFIAYSLDFMMLRESCRKAIDALDPQKNKSR